MKKISAIFLVLFLTQVAYATYSSGATSTSQTHADSLKQTLSCLTKNIYYLYGYDGWGGVPKEWSKQEALRNIANDSELDSLTCFASIPAIRVLSFHALASKHYNGCFDLLVKELKDTCSLTIGACDVYYPECVSKALLEISQQNTSLLSEGQIKILDSLLIFTPGLTHLNIEKSVSHVAGNPHYYERIRQLYFEGHENMLRFLADYKKPQDIEILISALCQFNVGLDKEGIFIGKQKGQTNAALDAVIHWPNDAFIEVLEELRDYELTRKYIDYSRIKLMFMAVMAYDNDWAYHFIEDMFENRGATTKFSYDKNLYKAYYEGQKLSRFLPLIEKYAKKPLI